MATASKLHGKTEFTRPSPTEVRATRTYDAPAPLVWECYTKPEHISKWLLGPDDWSMPVCEIDLRVGGAWKYLWRHNEGAQPEFFMSGEYTEIDAPKRLVYTERFMGQEPASTNIVEMTEVDGRTTVVATSKYPSKEITEQVLATGMESGWGESQERLAGYLASVRR